MQIGGGVRGVGSKENAMSDNAKDSYIHIYLLQSNLRDSIRLVVGAE